MSTHKQKHDRYKPLFRDATVLVFSEEERAFQIDGQDKTYAVKVVVKPSPFSIEDFDRNAKRKAIVERLDFAIENDLPVSFIVPMFWHIRIDETDGVIRVIIYVENYC